MDKTDSIKLSKTLSHALRHEPESYNLRLDNEGWVLLSNLVESLNNKGLNVTKEMIIETVEHSDKKRHQIFEGKIRAFYGHSINEKIVKQQQNPPDILYHGTITSNLTSIFEKGLLPMDRQYVHLSIDEETAKIVATRRKGKMVIIKVQAQEAYKNAIQFFKEENGVWLAESIPSKYISL